VAAQPTLLLALDLSGTFVFALGGAGTALRAAQLDIVGVVTLGIVTAIGGGIVRDLLVGRVPLVFSGELYATPALAGAAIAIGLDRLDQPYVISAWAGGLVCLVWRLLALRRDWRAPMPRGPANV
jgi:uncharacterized membrane protein YeiH